MEWSVLFLICFVLYIWDLVFGKRGSGGGGIIDGGVVDGAGFGLAEREEQIRGALVVARGFGDWEGEGEGRFEVLELAMRAVHRGERF